MALGISSDEFLCATVRFRVLDSETEHQYTIMNFEDLEKVDKCYEQSIASSSLFQGLLYPIRTNRNFHKDFFLPTYMNHAIEIKNVVLRVLCKFAFIFLDIATFPIRLALTPFRVVWNAIKPEHPLCQLIREKGWNPQLLAAEQLEVEVVWHKKDPKKKASESVFTKYFCTKQINVIDAPFNSKIEKSGAVSCKEGAWLHA